MNTRLKLMWIGIACLVLSWLVPPWTEFSRHTRDARGAFGGFHCLFSQDEYRESRKMEVDWSRLLLLDVAIVALTAGAIATVRKSS